MLVENLTGAGSAVVWTAGVVAALTALGAAVRWVGKRVARIGRKVDAAVEALVGREAIVHPDTGEVLAPATPGLGPRLASIEETLHQVADTRAELRSLTARVDGLQDRVDRHLVAECGTTTVVIPPAEPSVTRTRR